VSTDVQRVVAKQEIQEVEPAKRAGAQYAHHRNQAKDTNTKLRHQLAIGCEGAKRAIALSMFPHAPPPAGPHTDIQCLKRWRQNNRSNRQRRREDTANDPNS
jgi:hypothetical protein